MASQTQPSGLDRKRKGTGQRCGISCRVGIDGLVVWGGALAITGLMAIFTVRKTATKWKRRNGSITTPEESAKFSSEEAEDDNEERKKGLGLALVLGDCTGSLIQTDARHEQRSSETGMARVDSCASISSRTLSTVGKEEKINPKMGKEEEAQIQQQEILLLSDDPKPESIASCDDYCFAEEFYLPRNGKISVAGLPMSFAKQKEENSKGGGTCAEEYHTEEGQESLEETWDYSSEPAHEAVWAVGSTDEASPGLRELKGTCVREDFLTYSSEKVVRQHLLLEEGLFKNYQIAHLPNSGNRFFFVGMMLLLLLPPLLLSVFQESVLNTFYVVLSDDAAAAR